MKKLDFHLLSEKKINWKIYLYNLQLSNGHQVKHIMKKMSSVKNKVLIIGGQYKRNRYIQFPTSTNLAIKQCFCQSGLSTRVDRK